MSSSDKPVPPGGLAMLREDKLASRCVTGTRNGVFSDSAIHFANTLAGKHTEHAKMTGRVIENIRDQCKYTPLVTGRACCSVAMDRIFGNCFTLALDPVQR